MSNALTSEELQQLAEEIYGLEAAEQARIAKERGHGPDEDGLIEFEQPIKHIDVEGEEIGVYGVICPEDARKANENDVTDGGTFSEDGPDPADLIQPRSTGGRQGVPTYRWSTTHPETPGWQSFHGVGTHIASTPAGVLGMAVTGLHLSAESGEAPWAAGTRYATHRLDSGANNDWHWSPRRWSTNEGRYFEFTATVYAERAGIYYR